MRPRALWSLLLCSCAAHAASSSGGTTGVPGEAGSGDGAVDVQALASGEASPGQQADLQRALDLVRQDDPGARAALEPMATDAAHPYQGLAVALLAREALAKGDPARAKSLAESSPGLPDDAPVRFFEALALAQLGHGQAALDRLARWQDDGVPLLPSVPQAELALALKLAWAMASGSAGHFEDAFSAWQGYFDAGAEAERAYAVHQAEAMAGRIAPEMALELYASSRHIVPQLALGPRARAALAAQGKTSAAEEIDGTLARLRARLGGAGLEGGTPTWAGRGDPSRLGLLVPLSGPALPLGVAVARGAMVAIGPAPAPGDIAAFQVLARDSGRPQGGATRSAHELAQQEAVIGLVGVPDAATIEQMSRDGVPYLVLSDQTPGGHTSAFQLIHTPAARIQALVAEAGRRGVRRFAVLRPDDDKSAESARTFTQAVIDAGYKLVGEVAYAASATTFSREVDALKKLPCEAVFVPEDADRLELVAPALAVADLWPQARRSLAPTPESRGRGQPARREILLLSTARGLGTRLLERAGRYVQGALLAPGFFADDQHTTSGRFVTVFRELYGRDPGASDAFGFDGIHLLRTVVDRGARARADVLRMLGSGEYQGVTGRIRFAPDHTRADAALVYEVVGDQIRVVP